MTEHFNWQDIPGCIALLVVIIDLVVRANRSKED